MGEVTPLKTALPGIARRAVIAFVAFFSAIASAQSVHAQATHLSAPSPEELAIAPGGVDIRTGRPVYNKSDISIGDGPGAIDLVRMTPVATRLDGAPFGNLYHNWDITVTIQPDLVEAYNDYDYQAQVNYGMRSADFIKIYMQDSTFRPISQNDYNRLTTTGFAGAVGAVYTYQAKDGTTAVFRPTAYGECGAGECAFVSYIVEPDGTRFDFEYENRTATANKARLRSVTSSRGYALLFEYGAAGAGWNQISKACVINLGSVAKPANNICPAGSHATATYSYVGLFSSAMLASATGADGATEAFGYALSGSGSDFAMSFTKPGESAPWKTNTVSHSTTSKGYPEPIITAQSFIDGSSFTYSYEYTPFTGDPFGATTSFMSIAGGSFENALGHNTQVLYDFPPLPYSRSPPRLPGAPGYSYVNFGNYILDVPIVHA